MIAIGTMISLAYYLRVIAAVWMRPTAGRAPSSVPAMAGGSQEADAQITGGRCKVILGLVGAGHGGDDLLRRHPLAAGRLGHLRGRLDRHLIG